jgi:AAA domain
MYNYKVLLIGESGGGKTYSFRNMNKETTMFINIENKPLPFKGTFKHTYFPNSPQEVLNLLQQGSQNKEISHIVVDSFSAYVDMLLLIARSTKTGFEIWTYYNENIGKFNDYIKKVQKEVFVTAHYEVLTDDLGGMRKKRAKIKGREWEGLIEKDYTIVMYAESKMEFGEKKAKHFFTLQTDGVNSAKCPPDIFGEDNLTIDNDSNLVLEKIRDFIK